MAGARGILRLISGIDAHSLNTEDPMYCHQAFTFKFAAAGLVATAVAAAAASAAAMPPAQDFAAPAPARAGRRADQGDRGLSGASRPEGPDRSGRGSPAAASRRFRRVSCAVPPIVGTAVEGTVEVPIVTVTFSNTPGSPYPVADLQRQLFDGPWPTGTMSEHYTRDVGWQVQRDRTGVRLGTAAARTTSSMPGPPDATASASTRGWERC